MTECDDEKEKQKERQKAGSEQEQSFGESEIKREEREEKISGETQNGAEETSGPLTASRNGQPECGDGADEAARVAGAGWRGWRRLRRRIHGGECGLGERRRIAGRRASLRSGNCERRGRCSGRGSGSG